MTRRGMVDGMDQTTNEEQCAVTDDRPALAIDATGVYEIQSGVVLYDSEDPLAWVQADNAVKLAEMT